MILVLTLLKGGPMGGVRSFEIGERYRRTL